MYWVSRIGISLLSLFGISERQSDHSCGGCTMCMPPPKVQILTKNKGENKENDPEEE